MVGFYVAVQHALVVGGTEAVAELVSELQGLERSKAADPPQQRGQVFAVDVFHRDEVLVARLSQVVDPADVRMRDGARQTHLFEQDGELGGIPLHGLRQELERHRLMEHQVVGAVDLAHATAPEGDRDAVALCPERAR